MKPTYSGVSYKAALSKENAAKNAVQNILPRTSLEINSLSVMMRIITFTNVLAFFCMQCLRENDFDSWEVAISWHKTQRFIFTT
jgi:hypothetical protein